MRRIEMKTPQPDPDETMIVFQNTTYTITRYPDNSYTIQYLYNGFVYQRTTLAQLEKALLDELYRIQKDLLDRQTW
jgi:hypothetical protein